MMDGQKDKKETNHGNKNHHRYSPIHTYQPISDSEREMK